MIINCQEIICKPDLQPYCLQKNATVCEIFSYEPENSQQFPLGNLYMLTELRNVKDCGYMTNLLASIIKRQYYSNPAIGPFKGFQLAIKKANSHLAEMAKTEKTEWLSKLHFFCAVLAGENLFSTQAGRIQAHLWRQGNFSSLFVPPFKVPNQKSGQSPKIFGSIASGPIQQNDKIFIATPELEKIIPPASLRQIMNEKKEVAEIFEKINEVIKAMQKIPPLAALIIETLDNKPEIKTESTPKPKMTAEPIDLKELLK